MRRRVLIVEDEPHILRLIELTVRKGGYELLVARNGREALARFEADRPDLVVMDVMMPEMDGLEALQRMRGMEHGGEVPVIMLTVSGQSSMEDQAMLLGASLFLTKPFSPSQLLQEVRRLLGDEERSR